MDREKAIRKFIRAVLTEWHYPMPRLWFVKNETSAYFLDPPPRIRLRVNVDLETVLHELQHYRDHKDHLAIGEGNSQVIYMSELGKPSRSLKDESITNTVAKQLKHQYQHLWDQFIIEEEQELCDEWNSKNPVGTTVIFTDYWGKEHLGTTGEPAKVVYGKAVVWLCEPNLAARYELDRIRLAKEKS